MWWHMTDFIKITKLEQFTNAHKTSKSHKLMVIMNQFDIWLSLIGVLWGHNEVRGPKMREKEGPKKNEIFFYTWDMGKKASGYGDLGTYS